MIFFKNLFFF